MSIESLPIIYRPATEKDVSFIFNSWLKSYRNSSFARYISNTIYYTEHHKLIEQLVRDNQVIVACNEDDHNQLYGYICAGENEGIFTLHYIYIKHTYRNMGIGRTLLNQFERDPSCAAIYTHHNKIADRLAPKFNLIYHPYTALISNPEK